MSIQWFPGHMTRARREIEQKLRQIDLVMELLDARIPLSSRNPMIDQILRHKPRLILLNKADLADPAATREWADYFRKKTGAETIAVNSTVSGGAVKDITEAAETILSEKREARIRKGMNPRAIRALIVGIPNVGKSTLINTLAGRKIAATRGPARRDQRAAVDQGRQSHGTPGHAGDSVAEI